jgi:hypothetical protein
MPKLFQAADKSHYTYKCPGCNNFHTYYVTRPNASGSQWQFNGDVNSPFFNSTMRVALRDHKTGEVLKVCHSMIRYGRITFLADSDFMKNRTIEMEEILYS